MLGTDIKSLIAKLNDPTRLILAKASELAVNRTNHEVAAEHFFRKALENQDSDIRIATEFFKLDGVLLLKQLNAALESFSRGNTGRVVFSQVLLDLLEAAWVVGSIDHNHAKVRTGTVLEAYLKRPGLYGQGGSLPELAKISRDALSKEFNAIFANSVENEILPAPGAAGETPGESPGTGGGIPASGGEDFLSKYCDNFTKKAKEGKLDPVFGRDNEIRSMINILARRRKNNPILVGEPGVGKTAVMEGLALRISEGDVPENLQGVTLMALDLGLLEAGASVKGEFERRLTGVTDRIKNSPKPIILFIDEAHTLVGAGGSPGGSDASNLLKPALARGELRTCAATTWKEYKKYFEKDPALERRFQPVILDEPSPETAALILRGLRDSYEKSHGVVIKDEAIVTCAEMSDRYVRGRFLPDKAVDLLDTACARVKVGMFAKPAALEDGERKAQALRRELDGLERDQSKENGKKGGDAEELEKRIAAVEEENGKLREKWTLQRDAAAALAKAERAWLDAKKEGEGKAPGAAKPEKEDPEKEKTEEAKPEKDKPEDGKASEKEESPAPDEGKLFAEYETAKKNFQDLAGDDPLMDAEVTSEVVAKVVSDWTGIPLGRLAREQASTVANLESLLNERIKGQENALKAISRVIRASKAGLRDPARPMGVFLLAGPSGVGKTETGLALASLLFGDETSVITVNMSEFQEKFTVTRLTGSPPGYVGYGEGGVLTEAVRQKPYSVVLLDEVEKAHPDVLNLFYQVFDKGELSDGEGKKIGFKNTLILLTSNLGTDVMESFRDADPKPSFEETVGALRPALLAYFKPALLARMTVVPYECLDAAALTLITGQKLEKLKERALRNNGLVLRFEDGVAKTIAERCLDGGTGARNIDLVLEADVIPDLSKHILENIADKTETAGTMVVRVGPDGAFVPGLEK
ncbi:MAG: type VI secretion system ATPase TssH [Deltaproteobacteria bacterium]|jgi:type VI secretion system protein VasG|nr:type VI secretion system ATPase TssH [Deltaproteobacteria bacterium]